MLFEVYFIGWAFEVWIVFEYISYVKRCLQRPFLQILATFLKNFDLLLVPLLLGQDLVRKRIKK